MVTFFAYERKIYKDMTQPWSRDVLKRSRSYMLCHTQTRSQNATTIMTMFCLYVFSLHSVDYKTYVTLHRNQTSITLNSNTIFLRVPDLSLYRVSPAYTKEDNSIQKVAKIMGLVSNETVAQRWWGR